MDGEIPAARAAAAIMVKIKCESFYGRVPGPSPRKAATHP